MSKIVSIDSAETNCLQNTKISPECFSKFILRFVIMRIAWNLNLIQWNVQNSQLPSMNFEFIANHLLCDILKAVVTE